MNQEQIGKFIQERRKEKELTQIELAEKIGVSNRSVSKWENGKCLPDYSIMPDLCKELDITINELLSGKKLDNEEYQKSLENNFVQTIDYNNKQRNKKIKKWIISFIVLLIIFLLYKAFLVYIYLIPIYDISESALYGAKEISIKRKYNANTTYHNMQFKLPEEFELITDKAKSPYVQDRCDTYIKGYISESEYDAALLVCEPNDNTQLYSVEEYSTLDRGFPTYTEHFIIYGKYNINNGIDLLMYDKEHHTDKYNLFTPLDKVKLRYIAAEYTGINVYRGGTIYLLNKDINGFIYESSAKKRKYFYMFFIEENSYPNFSYTIEFLNENEEYFNKDNIVEFISTIDSIY